MAKRTRSPTAGPGRVHVREPITINALNRPICSVRSAPNAELAQPSCCRPATPKPCSFTGMPVIGLYRDGPPLGVLREGPEPAAVELSFSFERAGAYLLLGVPELSYVKSARGAQFFDDGRRHWAIRQSVHQESSCAGLLDPPCNGPGFPALLLDRRFGRRWYRAFLIQANHVQRVLAGIDTNCADNGDVFLASQGMCSCTRASQSSKCTALVIELSSLSARYSFTDFVMAPSMSAAGTREIDPADTVFASPCRTRVDT